MRAGKIVDLCPALSDEMMKSRTGSSKPKNGVGVSERRAKKMQAVKKNSVLQDGFGQTGKRKIMQP